MYIVNKKHCRRRIGTLSFVVNGFFLLILFTCNNNVSSLTLKFQIKSNNCTEAIRTNECPKFVKPKYNDNILMGTMAVCDKTTIEDGNQLCLCRDPFVGKNCKHLLSDDTAATVSCFIYYILNVPTQLYVTVSAWLVLFKKIKKRRKVNNMKAMQLMRQNSANALLWQKKTNYLACNCGLTVSSAVYITISTTIFFLRNAVDPMYLRGIFSKDMGYFLTTTSHVFGLVSFVQLFGAYTKLILRTGSPGMDKKCGKKAKKWLPRLIRRICLFLLFAQFIHQFLNNFHIVQPDNWYTINAITLGLIVLSFSTFTFYYGMTLIRKIGRLKSVLDEKDQSPKMVKHASNLSDIGRSIDENDNGTNDVVGKDKKEIHEDDSTISLDARLVVPESSVSTDAAKVIKSKRFFFITVLMKRYLLIMGVDGYCIFIVTLLHSFCNIYNSVFYVAITVALDMTCTILAYTIVRLLEATEESELYTVLKAKLAQCRNGNKKEPIFDDAIHGGNGGGARIETVNKAFGVEIADMEGGNTNKK
jgi:hypothetical protein